MKFGMLFILAATIATSSLPIHAAHKHRHKNHYQELKNSAHELGSTAKQLGRSIGFGLMKSFVIAATTATALIVIAPILLKGDLKSTDIALAAALGTGFFCFGKYHCDKFDEIMKEMDQGADSKARK